VQTVLCIAAFGCLILASRLKTSGSAWPAFFTFVLSWLGCLASAGYLFTLAFGM
jgi:hypothetical protein